jgi:hypothetical protein
VAIACQGGGSHAAFTAGVLKRLLDAEELAGYEVVGLSGTSGEAVCALLTWSALPEGDPAAAGSCWRTSGPTTGPPPRWSSWSTRERLTTGVHVDPTRKQVARDRVTWTVRASRDGGEPILGRAEAELRSGRVATLRLGA